MIHGLLWMIVRPWRLGIALVLFCLFAEGETVYRLLTWSRVDARVTAVETTCRGITSKDRQTEKVTASCDMMPKLKALAAAKGARFAEDKVRIVTFGYAPPGAAAQTDQIEQEVSAPPVNVGDVLPRLVNPSDQARSVPAPKGDQLSSVGWVVAFGLLLILSAPLFRWIRSFTRSEQEAAQKRIEDEFLRRRTLRQKLVMVLRAPVYAVFGLTALLSGLAALVTGGIAFLPEPNAPGKPTRAVVQAQTRDCEVKRTLYGDVEEKHVVASCADARSVTSTAKLALWTVSERANLTVSYEFNGTRRTADVSTSGAKLFTGAVGDTLKVYVGTDGNVTGLDERDIRFGHFLWAFGVLVASLSIFWFTSREEKKVLAELQDTLAEMAGTALRGPLEQAMQNTRRNAEQDGSPPTTVTRPPVQRAVNGRPVAEFGRRR